LTGIVTPLSEQFLIHVVKRAAAPPVEQNTDIGDALDAAQDFGVPPMSYWPYNAVSWLGAGQRCSHYATPRPESVNPFATQPDTPAHCFAQDAPPLAAFQKAKSIARNIQPAAMTMGRFRSGVWGNADNMERRVLPVLRSLGNGTPLLVAAKQADGGEGWADNGALTVADTLKNRDDLDTDDSPVGNHFIVLTGYDLDRRVILFRNSWGESWGEGGYGHVSFDVFNTPLIIREPFLLRNPKTGIRA
jgi:hypothetical protein